MNIRESLNYAFMESPLGPTFFTSTKKALFESILFQPFTEKEVCVYHGKMNGNLHSKKLLNQVSPNNINM